MLLNIFIISMVTLLNGCCDDSIKLQVLNKEIHVKPWSTTISFDLKINNGSHDSFLLYNFNSEADLAFREESFFCNDEIAAGATIFIYDEKMQIIYAVISPIPEDVNYKSNTAERVKLVIAEEQVKFRNSLQVIKPEQAIILSKKADLENFRLTPGTYYMKLLYASGDNTINMVTEDQMTEDRKKYKAEIFKGCVSSDTIKLIVE